MLPGGQLSQFIRSVPAALTDWKTAVDLCLSSLASPSGRSMEVGRKKQGLDQISSIQIVVTEKKHIPASFRTCGKGHCVIKRQARHLWFAAKGSIGGWGEGLLHLSFTTLQWTRSRSARNIYELPSDDPGNRVSGNMTFHIPQGVACRAAKRHYSFQV